MSPSAHRPRGTGIFLDHIAHWVPDMTSAAAELARLGFRLTPRTEHVHALAPGGTPEPAGTANQCIMLREGYLEILTVTRKTPLAEEIRAAMSRHVGVHLAAFGVDDATAEHRRLVAQGFPQRPPVALERETTLADGRRAALRFTVIRPQSGLLPEGRVQFLSHETPDLLWEERWLEHPNGALALTELAFCVADVDECARRFARYLRTDAAPAGNGRRRLAFERGALTIMSPDAAEETFAGAAAVPPPAMVGYALRTADLATTKETLVRAGYDPHPAGDAALVVPLAPSLGGVLVFHDGPDPRWHLPP